MKTRITEIFNIKYPIIQGGIQWLAKAELAAAVSNAGGLGLINATTFSNKSDLVKEIRKARELTDKPFGVNVSLLPKPGLEQNLTWQFIEAVCEEKVAVVETTGRNPVEFYPYLRNAGIKLIHKARTIEMAKTAEEIGADAVSVIGFEGAGHPGRDDVANMVLIPKAAESVTTPVLAAGGVCDAKSFLAALCLGAEGVIMGTRFMLTKEASIHENLKNWLLTKQEMDTMFTQRSIGSNYRVVKNSTAFKVLGMEETGHTLEQLLPIISGKRGLNAYETGDTEGAQITVGQVIGRIDSLKTIQEVIEDIVGEVDGVLQRMNQAMSDN